MFILSCWWWSGIWIELNPCIKCNETQHFKPLATFTLVRRCVVQIVQMSKLQLVQTCSRINFPFIPGVRFIKSSTSTRFVQNSQTIIEWVHNATGLQIVWYHVHVHVLFSWTLAGPSATCLYMFTAAVYINWNDLSQGAGRSVNICSISNAAKHFLVRCRETNSDYLNIGQKTSPSPLIKDK